MERAGVVRLPRVQVLATAVRRRRRVARGLGRWRARRVVLGFGAAAAAGLRCRTAGRLPGSRARKRARAPTRGRRSERPVWGKKAACDSLCICSEVRSSGLGFRFRCHPRVLCGGTTHTGFLTKIRTHGTEFCRTPSLELRTSEEISERPPPPSEFGPLPGEPLTSWRDLSRGPPYRSQRRLGGTHRAQGDRLGAVERSAPRLRRTGPRRSSSTAGRRGRRRARTTQAANRRARARAPRRAEERAPTRMLGRSRRKGDGWPHRPPTFVPLAAPSPPPHSRAGRTSEPAWAREGEFAVVRNDLEAAPPWDWRRRIRLSAPCR